VPGSLRQAIDGTTPAVLRARGSVKWAAPGPGGFGAGVAEMDFGAAPAILDALARLSADAAFGYLPPVLAQELSEACAEFARRRYGWQVDPALIHHVPDVIKALELAITRFSRPGSPVILPTPAYMPFLSVPGVLGREIIQVPMRGDDGFFTLDLDRIDAAFRRGGHLLIFCNPYNPLGRVFTRAEMAALTEVVDRHGEAWLDEVVGYLDESRRLLAGLLRRHLPGIRYRPPDGTYLAWLDCSALDLPGSPGELVADRARLTVVDGPAFGAGGPGSFRLNFATPQPILTEMVERIAAALNAP